MAKRANPRRRRFRNQQRNEVKEFDQGWIVGKTIYFINGDRYEGQRNLPENEMHGNGTYYWRDGREYKGQFYHGSKEGHGEFSGTDLSKYTGEFTDDKMEGFGSLNMPDGQVYVGHFSDWKRFGSGIKYSNFKNISNFFNKFSGMYVFFKKIYYFHFHLN